MADAADADAFLDDQFPARFRVHVPPALKGAYASVVEIAQDAEYLRLPSTQLGHLRAWAAELAIKRLIEAGKLPFDFDWQPYKNRTGNWLRIRASASVLSVHQINDPSAVPRRADYRSNGFANNQGVFDFPGLKDEQRRQGLPHLVLTHGHTELAFAHLGLPREVGRGYFSRSGNLLRLPHVADASLAPVEGAGVEPEVELKIAKDVEEIKGEIVRLIRDLK